MNAKKGQVASLVILTLVLAITVIVRKVAGPYLNPLPLALNSPLRLFGESGFQGEWIFKLGLMGFGMATMLILYWLRCVRASGKIPRWVLTPLEGLTILFAISLGAPIQLAIYFDCAMAVIYLPTIISLLVFSILAGIPTRSEMVIQIKNWQATLQNVLIIAIGICAISWIDGYLIAMN